MMFALAHKLHSMSERLAWRRLARSVTSAASGIICVTVRGMPADANQATMFHTKGPKAAAPIANIVSAAMVRTCKATRKHNR